MDSQRNFHIQTLSDEDSWCLFKSLTETRVEHPDLKSIAHEIAKECGGMPVAIVTVARALKKKGENEWKNALRELKIPSSESFEGITKEVYTSIQLSYNYQETKELKEIFLLCSRMGRIYDASVRDLFRYGWGLGLFDKYNTMEEALCNAYTSVNQLKAASLLLDAPKSEFTLSSPPDRERFAMHDVVCYVARSIASRDRHLNNIFSFSTITALPQRQEIEVHDCGKMEEIFAIGEQDDGNNNEVVHEIKISQLRILSLANLPWLNSFCCKVKTASPFQLTSDTNAREIISEEELDIPTSLFDDKVCPGSKFFFLYLFSFVSKKNIH
ncbi:hypothetical protein ACOSQ3_008906 [Xanthoceras sorbifolium]